MVVQRVLIVQHDRLPAPTRVRNGSTGLVQQIGHRGPYAAAIKGAGDIVRLSAQIQHSPLGGGEVGQKHDIVPVHQHLSHMERGPVVFRRHVYRHRAGGQQLRLLLICAEVVQQPLVQSRHHGGGAGDDHQRGGDAGNGQFFQLFHGVDLPFRLEKAVQPGLLLLRRGSKGVKHTV